MLPMNKLSTLIAVLMIIVFDVKAVPSAVNNLTSSNITNQSSIVGSKSSQTGAGSSGSCICNCPSVCSSSSSAAASTSSNGSSCFASDTLVTLTNQKRVPIQQLRPGNELLTTDGFTIFTTQMIMMLDKNRFSQTMFHTILTASGHHVSLTELHMIPVIQNNYTINYIPAKQVKNGDVVYVMSDGQLMTSTVTDVIIEMKTGYYAPLTISGTLLANDIMTSCYANVQSHEAAQFYMAPLRWYHQIAQFLSINEPFGHQKVDGMHIIPHIMYEFGRFFRPTTLRLT